VFDVLNAAKSTLKHFAQDSFALVKSPSPNIFSVVHQKIVAPFLSSQSHAVGH
jgi:hypothetical protein